MIERLYEIAESQGGFLAAHQAMDAGIPRSTLSYHATEGDALERVGRELRATAGTASPLTPWTLTTPNDSGTPPSNDSPR